MEGPPAQIVVLTPVRNEAWILAQFLVTTSCFADRIIVADQGSTDGSREICARFPKVRLIENPASTYDEADRQRLLVRAARDCVAGAKVLIALDADEVASADSLTSTEWSAIRRLPPGTALYFPKPDVYRSPLRVELVSRGFPLGLVDDGREHAGKLIHSTRLPIAQTDRRYDATGIRFLHLACMREYEYTTRQAYYCMLENINCTSSWRVRNLCYSPWAFKRRFTAPSVPMRNEWVATYRCLGFDLEGIRSERYNQFHACCLDLFARHGTRRFWFDSIWWEDWSAVAAALRGPGHSPEPLPWWWVNVLRAVGLGLSVVVATGRQHIRRLVPVHKEA